MAAEVRCCEADFFIHIVVVVFLVVFAGLMSGLTLGLMSLSLIDLEVLAKSGTPKDKRHALKILPVVKNQHLLLRTLLICNAAAMEIIPQSVCSRHGHVIGAALAPMLLDLLLGDGHRTLFRRAKLKTLVNLHGNEVKVENSHMMRQLLLLVHLNSVRKLLVMP